MPSRRSQQALEAEAGAQDGSSASSGSSEGARPRVVLGRPNTEQLELEDRGLSKAEAAAVLDLKVARYMYYAGFALLPWVWFIAWAHFRKVAKLPHSDPQLATYVRRCGVGAAIGGLAIATWYTYMSLTWRTWGPFGRSLMIVAPEEVEL